MFNLPYERLICPHLDGVVSSQRSLLICENSNNQTCVSGRNESRQKRRVEGSRSTVKYPRVKFQSSTWRMCTWTLRFSRTMSCSEDVPDVPPLRTMDEPSLLRWSLRHGPSPIRYTRKTQFDSSCRIKSNSKSRRSVRSSPVPSHVKVRVDPYSCHDPYYLLMFRFIGTPLV